MTDLSGFLASSLEKCNQPQSTFDALEKIVDKTIGIKLFTLMEIDRDRGVARRNYSNQPDAYPVSGEKPIQQNEWTRQVQDRHETFVANSIDEIAQVFPDHELIASLGCQSCLNLPIVINGIVIGTLNCLHEAGHYTEDRIVAAQALKQPGAMAFLLSAFVNKRTENE